MVVRALGLAVAIAVRGQRVMAGGRRRFRAVHRQRRQDQRDQRKDVEDPAHPSHLAAWTWSYNQGLP